MKIGLNRDEGCTVTINHTGTLKTHSVVISNLDNEKLHIREFNSPTSDNSDYTASPKLPSLRKVRYHTDRMTDQSDVIKNTYNTIKKLGNFA